MSAAGVIKSDFLERAQFRGEKSLEAAEDLKKVLETSPITQTPEQVRCLAMQQSRHENIYVRD